MSPDTGVTPLPPPPAPVSVDATLATGIAVPAVPRLLWLALGIGALCDLALRSGVVSLGGALLVAGTAVALLASGRLESELARNGVLVPAT